MQAPANNSRSSSGPGPAAQPGRFSLVATCALLVAAVLLVYWPVTRAGFINYDDEDYVLCNPHVQGGLNWQGVAWAFAQLHGDQTYWHPLTWISHMLDCEFFGLAPRGHHMVNLSIHALNAILVFLLFQRMTGALWRSAFLAAVFALHPLQVDTVAWVAERKNLLSALFWFLTMLAYLRYVSRPRWGRYALVVVLFALGLMCKPVLVTLPFALLLLDFWPLQRFAVMDAHSGYSTAARLIREKGLLILLSAGSCAVTIVGHQQLGAMDALSHLPLGLRLENAAISYVVYIGKVIWPFDLAVFYPFPATLSLWKAIICGLALLAASGLAMRTAARFPPFCVGWFWFLGALVPCIGLLQAGGQAMADRFMYIPLIGILVLFSWGLAEFGARCSQVRLVIALVGVGLVVLFAVRSTNQSGYWKDSESLFQHALKVTEGNYIALNNLATLRFNAREFDQAAEYYRRAIRAAPFYADALDGLGAALEAKGDPEAIWWYQKALQANPSHPDALYNMGNALLTRGRPGEAIECFKALLRLRPDNYKARNNLGNALLDAGRLDEAVKEYLLVLQSRPGDYPPERNLGRALMALGRFDDAATHFRAALKLESGDAFAHDCLGQALAVAGRWEEASEEYAAALRLAPDNPETLYNLGYAMRMLGRLAEAQTRFFEAVRLKPAFPLAEYNLGCVLAEEGCVEEGLEHFRAALWLKPDYREAAERLRQLGQKSE